jgi:PPM family protein phosphatase
MTLEIGITMHRGDNPGQQDGLLVAVNDSDLVRSGVFQEADLPVVKAVCPANHAFLAVADGVAVSPMPNRASKAVLEELLLAFNSYEMLQEGLASTKLIRHVHGRLCDRLAGNRRTHGASTTLAVVHIWDDRLAVLNVGDSRVYHADASGQWRRLSKDHTLLQGMIDRCEATPDKEYASIYDGLEHMLVADVEERDFAIHRVTSELRVGDTLVLCTDGVHDTLGETEMWRLFDPDLGVAEQTTRWRQAVLKKGAPDNFSLICARVTSNTAKGPP